MRLGEIQILCMILCQCHSLELGEGPTFLYNAIPTFMTLFELFRILAIMDDIVSKTNRYATQRSLGRTRGGPNWEELTVGGLEAFMAIALYMGMKKQPNYKTYWMKDSFFQCSKISSIFSHAHFIDLVGASTSHIIHILET